MRLSSSSLLLSYHIFSSACCWWWVYACLSLFAPPGGWVVVVQAVALRKDVCVIGGGAAGSYSAYELQKRGYDVVLFEPQNTLGGNCERFQVPSTVTEGEIYTIPAAVLIFANSTIVTDFLTEFNNVTMEPRGLVDEREPYVFDQETPGSAMPAPPTDVQALF